MSAVNARLQEAISSAGGDRRDDFPVRASDQAEESSLSGVDQDPPVTLRHGRSHQHPAAGRLVARTGTGANAAITISRTSAPNSLNLIAQRRVAHGNLTHRLSQNRT